MKFLGFIEELEILPKGHGRSPTEWDPRTAPINNRLSIKSTTYFDLENEISTVLKSSAPPNTAICIKHFSRDDRGMTATARPIIEFYIARRDGTTRWCRKYETSTALKAIHVQYHRLTGPAIDGLDKEWHVNGKVVPSFQFILDAEDPSEAVQLYYKSYNKYHEVISELYQSGFKGIEPELAENLLLV